MTDIQLVRIAASTIPPGGPFSPAHAPPTRQHLEQLVAARERARPITRAARWAIFNGWGCAIFGGLTILTGLSSWPALLLGCAMCIVAHVELRGGAQLRRLRAESLRGLVRNQMLLGGMLFAYGLWNLVAADHGSNPYSEMLSSAGLGAEGDAMFRSIGELSRTLTMGLYAALMAIGLLVPGATALYYRSRAQHLARYIVHTPAWILDLQRGGYAL